MWTAFGKPSTLVFLRFAQVDEHGVRRLMRRVASSVPTSLTGESGAERAGQ
jgi:hypothetical protein